MITRKKVVAFLLSSMTVAGFVAAATFGNPASSSAASQAQAVPTAQAPTPVPSQGSNQIPLLNDRSGGPRADHDTYLANALGISATDLQAAQKKALEAALQQAVKDGRLTQAQADAIVNGTARIPRGVLENDSNIDSQALLATALNISVDRLQAAQETAFKAELQQAVTDGRMTQEQADLALAQHALDKYIADKGLFKNAVQQAVTDGVLTQAQADAMLAQARPGMFGGFGGEPGPGRGHGGPGGPGMHDGPRGNGQAAPQGTVS